MDILIPTIPAGVGVLLAFFSPYAVAVFNHPRWPATYKRFVALGVTLALAVLSLVGYFLLTGDKAPDWPQLVFLFLVISQASYALLLKPSVKAVEASVGIRDNTSETAPYQR